MYLDFVSFIRDYWWVLAIVIIALMILIVVSTLIPQFSKKKAEQAKQQKVAAAPVTQVKAQEEKVEEKATPKRGRPAKAQTLDVEEKPVKPAVKKEQPAPKAAEEENSPNYVVSYNEELKMWIVKKENGKKTLGKFRLKAEAQAFAKERADAMGGEVISKTRQG